MLSRKKISRQSEMVWWMVNTKLVDLAWNNPTLDERGKCGEIKESYFPVNIL